MDHQRDKRKKLFKMNDPGVIASAYNDFITGNVYKYGFNRPSKVDTLLPLDKATQNTKDLASYENNFQGYLYFYNQDRNINISENMYDDYMTLACASGAINFLLANGFPKNLDSDALDVNQFIQMLTTLKTSPTSIGVTYPLNINLFSNLYQLSNMRANTPTMGPTMRPTCSPCVNDGNDGNDGNEDNEKLTTKKQAYFSLIGALVFFLLSLPIMYRLTDVVFGSIGLNTQSYNGSPTYAGIFIHFLVYFLIIFGIMKLFEKKKN
jgi:hypothetical protein